MTDPVMQPLIHELIPVPSVSAAFEPFCSLPGVLLLDSSRQLRSSTEQPLGRYSFLMADPFDWIEVSVGTPNPFESLRARLRDFKVDRVVDLPPMQGGYAGVLSYDLNRSFESNLGTLRGPSRLPAVALGGYDIVLAWDHERERAWLISTGFPERNPSDRTERAKARIESWLKLLSVADARSGDHAKYKKCSKGTRCGSLQATGGTVVGTRELIANGSDVEGMSSNFTKAQYQTAVQQSMDYIYAGDVFQVNLAQRLDCPARQPSSQLFESLRHCNPAPFSGYFDVCGVASRSGPDFQIVSASPERLIAVRDRQVETRPIKGTRRRTGIPMVDIENEEQLLGSAKDRAENVMIVDLMRNDLSRCCTDDSVVVTQLCELERYQSVVHLVSAVEAELRPDADLVDLIESVFPGGSITGAPKHRAMQIIAELEPDPREAYCGSLGYFGFTGDADFNILIRTIIALDGRWYLHVGGGIVSKSKPQEEYDETWVKAASMLRAIRSASETV